MSSIMATVSNDIIRLRIHDYITDVLVDLAEIDKESPDYEDDREGLANVTDIILEGLSFEITTIKGNAVTCRVTLPE